MHIKKKMHLEYILLLNVKKSAVIFYFYTIISIMMIIFHIIHA